MCLHTWCLLCIISVINKLLAGCLADKLAPGRLPPPRTKETTAGVARETKPILISHNLTAWKNEITPLTSIG